MIGPVSARYIGHVRVLAQQVREGSQEAALELIRAVSFKTLTEAAEWVARSGPCQPGWFDVLADAWRDREDLQLLEDTDSPVS